ncbi:MAG TPA: hypothetical protein VGU63_12515 [Candidatus Acidoferrales bacterium]|nr:hypothetical protein [Candidatus Acidoferrales bacterium]
MATSSTVHRSSVRHEKRDARVPALGIFGGVMLLTIAVVLVGMKFLFFSYAKAPTIAPSAAPFVTERVLPPEPRLQPDPEVDLAVYLDQQKHELSTYGWVDRENGVVRIPIDRAMQLLLKQGLPVHSSGQPSTRMSTGAAASARTGVETNRPGNRR